MRLHEHTRRLQCPYCRSLLEGARWRCEDCRTSLHLACFREHGRCTTHGCRSRSSVRRAPPLARHHLPSDGLPGIIVAFVVGCGILILSALRFGPSSPPKRTFEPAPFKFDFEKIHRDIQRDMETRRAMEESQRRLADIERDFEHRKNADLKLSQQHLDAILRALGESKR